MHFDWEDMLYIEMDSMDSIKVPCKVTNYITLFRNLLCAGKPNIKEDCDGIPSHYIDSLKEIKNKLNSMAILED